MSSKLGSKIKFRKAEIRSRNSESVSFSVFLIISIAAAIYYGLLFFNPTYRGDLIAYIFLLIIESYIVIQTVGSWMTMMYADFRVRDPLYYETIEWLKNDNRIAGGVDVFITTFNENPDVIEKTVKAVKEMDIEHTTYILDDGKSEEVKKIANHYGVLYVTREGNKDAKAGNINNGLKIAKGKYFAIFDADYIPKKNFLIETLPFFSKENIALVQTPQVYRNKKNLISRGADGAQRIFYEVVLKGKNKFNAVFWLGTNAVFRRKAIDEIGGIYPHKSEDLFTTYLIHQNGWKTVYIPNILATGLGPDTIDVYHKQQVRWASGGFHMFFKQNPLSKNLTFDQKIQYLLSSTFYFSGIVVLLMMIMPLLYLLFGIVPIHASLGVWAIHYIPFFLLQFVVILSITGKMNKDSYLLSINSFLAYIEAFFNVLFSKEVKWEASGSLKRTAQKKPIDYLWFHILIFLLSITSIPVGLINMDRPAVTAINIFWVLLNSLLLGTYIVFNLTYKKN